MSSPCVEGFEPVTSGLHLEGLAVDPERGAVLWYLEESKSYDLELSKVALGVFGAPDDIAPSAIVLASDESNYVTGQTLGVDGGSTMF